MSYRVELTAEAQKDLRREGLPRPVALAIARQLFVLADDPTALSVRSRFPFRELCQLYPFDLELEGVVYYVNVLFQYGQDEERLVILAIGVQEAPRQS